MDELETRVAALELLFVEMGPWGDRQQLIDARASIRAGMSASCQDELTIRSQAVELINDALKRFEPPVEAGPLPSAWPD